jgi:hypothetical protein
VSLFAAAMPVRAVGAAATSAVKAVRVRGREPGQQPAAFLDLGEPPLDPAKLHAPSVARIASDVQARRSSRSPAAQRAESRPHLPVEAGFSLGSMHGVSLVQQGCPSMECRLHATCAAHRG